MRRTLVIGTALLALAACSSEPDLGPVFDSEGGQPVSCLTHQSGEPGAAYTDRELRDTNRVLPLMRYYTAHGTLPFCDSAPAGDSDRAWARTYLDLGGAPDRVTSVLG